MANTRPCLPSTGVFLRQWSGVAAEAVHEHHRGARVASHGVPIRWPSLPRTSPPRRRRGDARRARREGTRRRPRRPRRRRGRAEGQARACHGRSASRRRCRARRRPRVCRRRGGRAPRRARGGSRRWRRTSRSMSLGARGSGASERCPRVSRVASKQRFTSVTSSATWTPDSRRDESARDAGISGAARACPISLGSRRCSRAFEKSFLPPPRLQTRARHRVAH